MRTLPADVVTELAKEVLKIAHLVTFFFDTTYYYTDNDLDIYYSENWYTRKGITFEPASYSITPQADSITFSVDNADLSMSQLFLYEDVRGKECWVERVCLDVNNAVLGESVIIFLGYIDSISCDRKRATVKIFNHMIKWKTPTPRRLHSPNCQFVFKGDECSFTNRYEFPASDSTCQWTCSSGSTHYDLLNDMMQTDFAGTVYPVDDTYVYSAATSEPYEVLGLTAPAFSTGTSVTSITLYVRAKSTGSSRPLTGFLRIDSTDYSSTGTIAPTTDFDTYSLTFTNNPKTSSGWTYIHVNQTSSNALNGFGFKITSSSSNGSRVDVSQCYIKSARDTTTVCNYTPETCLSLDNRLQFGGFRYISDLAQKEIWWGTAQKIWYGKV